mgnify:CR=1 FL=1
MKKGYAILLLMLSTVFYAQDKLATVDTKMTEVLALIEKGDVEKLKQLSTQKMYCLQCFENSQGKAPYLVDSKTFYKKHSSKIFNQDVLKRIKEGEKKIITEEATTADYIALYTIYKANELAEGHEGMQFAFWFKEESGSLKLSGVETIP